ncbi:hypothetical protein HNY42_02130 [Exiguobacterium sp. Helios]|uniref:hypothetical protein n=1 Tax=unclassified Exiguobacterium TaxID=2644629 RepID=UPI000E92063C|nr:hypothetical protein [Exiguobacterium sp. Helios]QNR19800.1 hypothetical protein HNY42_02130 [Exiguobacterium sp. Helios]HBQ77428.1 hypothetical protein [Exiguobacterium sp.]
MKKNFVFAGGLTVLLHIGYAIYFYTVHEANATYQPTLPKNSTVLSQDTSFVGKVGSQTESDPSSFFQDLFLWSIPLTFISLMVLLFFIQNIQRRTS